MGILMQRSIGYESSHSNEAYAPEEPNVWDEDQCNCGDTEASG